MDKEKLIPKNHQEGKFDSPAEKKPDPFFESSDLFLCAYLKAKGIVFEGAKRGEGKRVTFLFLRQPDLEGLVKSYFNDGLVPVQSFKSALRNLRDIIFGESRS
jgi:hypothetical protein